MHSDIQRYYSDPRRFDLSKQIPHVAAGCPDAVAFYLATKDLIMERSWHWLQYLYNLPMADPNLLALANLCARAERQLPNLGVRYIKELAALGGAERNEHHYEQILQLFAEVLVINQILKMPWSGETSFMFEPAGTNGLRPDFCVVDRNGAYNFEVKAPSLLSHQRKRASAGAQIPIRTERELTAFLRQTHSNILLPRDNPIKDFLISAESKFSGFPRQSGANILVIVWDDFIYEPVGSLTSENAGLLTRNSFYRSGTDAVFFESIDAVFCFRHMNVFQEGLAERPLPDGRTNMFDLSRNPHTPNVFVPTPWGNTCPQFIIDGFGALRHDDERLQSSAEYRNPEYIFYV